jgi:hypothetical protein
MLNTRSVGPVWLSVSGIYPAETLHDGLRPEPGNATPGGVPAPSTNPAAHPERGLQEPTRFPSNLFPTLSGPDSRLLA